MSLFHHHDHSDANHPEDALTFDVLDDDGGIRRYSRDDFDQIFVSTDPAEVQRQVEKGWVILGERQVEEPGRGPSGEDLLPGIEGLRVGGILRYEQGETVTSYVVGYLKDGAAGGPVE